MKTVNAIQTTYAGCRFRSRLEARWAVFFDSLGITWEYEVQGYELPSGRYLPDFWLPSLNTHYEVKGQKPTAHESALAYELSEGTEQRVLIAWGQIPRRTNCNGRTSTWPDENTQDIWLNGSQDYDYGWCVCTVCGKPGCEFDARSSRICHHDQDDKTYTGGHWRIQQAFNRARSARFEHGESG